MRKDSIKIQIQRLRIFEGQEKDPIKKKKIFKKIYLLFKKLDKLEEKK